MREEENQEKSRNRIKGILSIILSAAGFAGMGFFVKMAGNVPVMEKAMFRNAVAAMIALLMMKQGSVSFYVEKENRSSLFLRCFFGTSGLLCNFWALSYLKLGDASILQKMAPFFSIIMSIFILGERPNKIAILSVILALCGAAFGQARSGASRGSGFDRASWRILCRNGIHLCAKIGLKRSQGSADSFLFFAFLSHCGFALLHTAR